MSNGIFFLFLIVGTLFIIWYLVIPIQVYSGHRIAIEPTAEVIDRFNYPIPEALQERLDHDTQQLSDAGFEPLVAYILNGYGPSIEFLVYGFVNRETSRMASITALLLATPQNRSLRGVQTAIESHYRDAPFDGLSVGNSRDAGPFFQREREFHGLFPHVADVRHLIELLDRLERRHCPGATRYLKFEQDFGGDVMAYCLAKAKENLQTIQRHGHLVCQPGDQQYRMPLRSVYWTLWHIWWPMRIFYRRHHIQQGKKLERELMASEAALDR